MITYQRIWVHICTTEGRYIELEVIQILVGNGDENVEMLSVLQDGEKDRVDLPTKFGVEVVGFVS